MGEPKPGESVGSGDGATERNPSIPASEEGTGMVPGGDGDPKRDTHLPASEADTGQIEESDDSPTQSWPGSGPGSIPPPG